MKHVDVIKKLQRIRKIYLNTTGDYTAVEVIDRAISVLEKQEQDRKTAEAAEIGEEVLAEEAAEEIAEVEESTLEEGNVEEIVEAVLEAEKNEEAAEVVLETEEQKEESIA